MKLSDYVIHFLEQQGVKDVFLLTGGGMMHLLDSVARSEKIEKYYNLHEQASAICADAYGQYTNGFGVCMVTTGPGATNAITGVVSAYQDSTPMLVISGQVKTTLFAPDGVRVRGPQEVQITKLVKDVTKYAVTVTNKDEIRYHLEKAVHLATTGRKGPVWLDIPLDIQAADINVKDLVGFTPCVKQYHVEQSIYEDILFNLLKAKSPLVLFGRGVIAGEASQLAVKLVDQLGIPFVTNWRAKDMGVENHELFFGYPGTPAPRYSNFILQNTDFLLVVGSRLDMAITAFNPEGFAPKAKKYIVDIDINELHLLSMPIEKKIHCDAKQFLAEILATSKKNNMRLQIQKWISFCSYVKEKYPIHQERMPFQSDGIYGFDFAKCLSEKSSENDIFVVSPSGRVFTSSVLGIKLKNGQRAVVPNGLGSMGYGLPSAIGACIASGKKRTIIFEGDGSLQHNLQELQLLKTYNLPIKLFVNNNGGYSSIYSMQNNHFKGNHAGCTSESDLVLPSIEKIASVYDLKYSKISCIADLGKGLEGVLSTNEPEICEIIGDIRFEEIPRTQTRVNPDGSLSSSRLEDLYPFIDVKEFFSWNL